jgi:hypothetical protein
MSKQNGKLAQQTKILKANKKGNPITSLFIA